MDMDIRISIFCVLEDGYISVIATQKNYSPGPEPRATARLMNPSTAALHMDKMSFSTSLPDGEEKWVISSLGFYES